MSTEIASFAALAEEVKKRDFTSACETTDQAIIVIFLTKDVPALLKTDLL
ncbi:MAG: hypothetical protein IPG91_23410 [Ideonella sp.]|nr:hypothetical protein [Ideonella sp.]